MGFRQKVAEYLILHKEPPRRGRPSAEEIKQNRANVETKPMNESRFDGYGHFAEYDEKKEAGRCKLEGCTKKVHTFCKKCNVHLCLIKGRNCFLKFHNK